MFEIDAVHLGDLSKIDIGHDGVGHGEMAFACCHVKNISRFPSKVFGQKFQAKVLSVFVSRKWLVSAQSGH